MPTKNFFACGGLFFSKTQAPQDNFCNSTTASTGAGASQTLLRCFVPTLNSRVMYSTHGAYTALTYTARIRRFMPHLQRFATCTIFSKKVSPPQPFFLVAPLCTARIISIVYIIPWCLSSYDLRIELMTDDS